MRRRIWEGERKREKIGKKRGCIEKAGNGEEGKPRTKKSERRNKDDGNYKRRWSKREENGK